MEIPERIAKILARAGVASRRESEKLIRSGDVTVNENIIKDPSTKIRKSDRVKVRGKIIGSAEATRVWRYYKPKGLVTSLTQATIWPRGFFLAQISTFVLSSVTSQV